MSFCRFFLIPFFLVFTLNAKNLKDISLQLQWKHQFQFAGYYIAKEKGFYKDIGLNVKIKEFESGMNITDELLSNKSQFGIGRTSLIIDKSQNKDIVLTAAIFQSSPLVLLGIKSDNLKSIKDIKNKKIMITEDARETATILSMIFSNNMSKSDVIMQKHSFDVNDLINGKTDLMYSYISNEPYFLEKRNLEPLILDPKNFGYDYYSDFLYTTNEFAKNNYELTKEFTKASLKGWEYAFNNIEETVDLILNKYNTLNKTRSSLIYEAKELKKLTYYNTNEIGKIEKRKIETIFGYFKLMGLIKKDIDFSDFILDIHDTKKSLTFEELNYLKDKKYLNLCIDPNWMPYEMFAENGMHIGITSDYFKIIQEKLPVKFNVQKTQTWDETIKLAKNKKCDVMSLMMKTPNRLKFLDFTDPYLNVPLVVVSRDKEKFIDNLSELKFKNIVMPKGYAFVQILRNKFPNLNILEVKDINEGLELVRQNKAFAYIGTVASVAYSFQKNYETNLKIIAKLDETWDLSIGVKKGDTLLLSIMQKSLDDINLEKRKEIFNKWILIKYDKNIDYTVLYAVLSFFLIVIIVFVSKQRVMKKFNKILENKIEEKTKDLKKAQEIAKLGFWSFYENNETIELSSQTCKILDLSYEEDITILKSELIEKIHILEGEELFIHNRFSEPSILNRKIKTSKGNIKYIEERFEIKVIDSCKKYIGIIQDITDQKEVQIALKLKEKELFEKSKLAQMGEMMDAIAHQWKQPLNFISIKNSDLQFLNEEAPQEITKEYIQELTIEVNQQIILLSETIDEFRKFFRVDNKKESTNIEDMIKGVLSLNKSLVISNNIKVVINTEKDLYVDLVIAEFKHVFINILSNAKDAFISNNIENRIILFDIRKNDNYIDISIKDSAGGIPKNIIESIFKAHVTNKKDGTGIGLYMSKQIIDKLNGSISVKNIEFEYENKILKGANFLIKIPILSK